MNLSETPLILLLFSAAIASLYGYGAIIVRYIFPQWSSYLGLIMLFGLLLFLAVSGYIELFHLGASQAFHWMIALGICLALIAVFLNHIQSSKNRLFLSKTVSPDYKKIMAIIFATFFVIAYCINMLFHDFNRGDDYSSYLIFPIRILAEGFSGGDAFNLRGIEHGLGGGDYINALILSISNLASLHLAEAGLGLILLGLLCIDQVKITTHRFWPSYCALIVACIGAIFAQYTNVTPILSGCAIGFGMLMIGQRMPQYFSPKMAMLLGALCGALIALKGNLLAPALMILGVIFLVRMSEERRTWTLAEIVIALLSCCVFLLPWMLASKDNHGTLFYPLLGRGFTYSGGFGLVPQELFWGAVREFIPLYSLTFVSVLVFWIRSHDQHVIRFSFILLMAMVISTLVIALTPAGMYRYCYVILATPCIYFLINNLSILSSPISKRLLGLNIKNTRYLIYLIIFVSSILMLHQTKRVGNHLFHDAFYTRYIKFNPDKLPDTDMLSPKLKSNAKRYFTFQELIPAGERLVAQVELPFLFDYRRNTIWVMDYPGSAGPEPLPHQGSPEDLALYLRKYKIRYIAHSYQAWLTRIESEYFIKHELNPSYEWNKGMVQRELRINDQILNLSQRYQIIYDDDRDRVIDLCMPKSQATSICD